MTGLILLTGGTGFVGRQVLKSLSAHGKKIRVVVRDGKQKQLVALNAIESIVTTQDLFAENAEWWTTVCGDIDTVIHVAWYAEPQNYLQSPKNFDCLIGTLQLAKGAIKSGVRRFIGVGTCVEYDIASGSLAIDTPLLPLTPYAEAKVAAFTALSQWLPRQGVEFAWCRLFYLHGEAEDPRRLVPYIRTQLSAGKPAELTLGHQIRDFLDVTEAGRMIAQTALGRSQGPINICSGKPTTVRQLAEKIAGEYGRPDLLKFGARPENPLEFPPIVGIR